MQPVDLKDYTPLPLPWTEEAEEKRLLHKLISISLGLFISLFVIVNFLITAPEIKREQLEKVPERLAKLMLEKKREPIPEPKKIELEPEVAKPEAEKPKPEPEPEKPKPEPELEKPKPVTQLAPKPKPIEPTPEQLKEARDKAANSGIMAMKNQLQALQNLTDLNQLGNKQLRDAKAGSSARADRNLIGRRALDGSGGIQTTAVSKPSSATLAGRQTTRIDAPAEIVALASASNKNRVQQRTQEEINLAFDRSKSGFYSSYRRALRTQL